MCILSYTEDLQYWACPDESNSIFSCLLFEISISFHSMLYDYASIKYIISLFIESRLEFSFILRNSFASLIFRWFHPLEQSLVFVNIQTIFCELYKRRQKYLAFWNRQYTRKHLFVSKCRPSTYAVRLIESASWLQNNDSWVTVSKFSTGQGLFMISIIKGKRIFEIKEIQMKSVKQICDSRRWARKRYPVKNVGLERHSIRMGGRGDR